jgi:hypothetical protein
LIIRVRSRIRGNSYQKEGIQGRGRIQGERDTGEEGYREREIQGKKKHTGGGDIVREGSAVDRCRVYKKRGIHIGIREEET